MSDEIDVHVSNHQSTPIADLLKKSKREIIELWESRSRAEIPAAHDKDSHTIQDELSAFLDRLCEAFQSKNLQEKASDACKIAVAHGQQRSGISGYSLAQVIREYAVLRQVLIEVLRKYRTLNTNEHTVIDWIVDEAIVASANVFAEAEHAKLKLALAEAHRSIQDLDHFAMIAAHDLKSPLNSIAGFSSLIEDEYRETARPEIRECMDFIQGAVKRMTTLIDGILEYAKLTTPIERFSVISGNNAVQAAVQNLKGVLTEKSGRVLYGELPSVRGDLILLTQLFQNLISNALKFQSTEPPCIRIDVISDKDFWIFSVKDNGIGFDPKDKHVIFALYKRLGPSKQSDGTGIGLATCRRVVELHGGKIWAESEPGKGSTFFFTIPKDKEESKS